jgi:hypothetical protein
MSWNYRIVHYRAPQVGYGLHEVYYNDKGEPVTMGAGPATFVAFDEEGPPSIVKALENALRDAKEREVLEEPDEWPGLKG